MFFMHCAVRHPDYSISLSVHVGLDRYYCSMKQPFTHSFGKGIGWRRLPSTSRQSPKVDLHNTGKASIILNLPTRNFHSFVVLFQIINWFVIAIKMKGKHICLQHLQIKPTRNRFYRIQGKKDVTYMVSSMPM